jgi:hypothetical protein
VNAINALKSITAPMPNGCITGFLPILNKYAQMQWILSCPTSGKGCQPTHTLKGTVGLRQARRQARRRKTLLPIERCVRLAEAESE